MSAAARIFISVAEDSADVHAASLLRAASQHLPACRFYGLTGPRMRAAGADTQADLAANAAMLTGVANVFRRALATVRMVEQSWRRERPDLVVLLDSPELHLGVRELGLVGLAGRARRLGIPVLYYIAPQTWASRSYRNAWIRRDVTRLACILPFEADYFQQRGIAAEFVGHPLFEVLARNVANDALVERLRRSAGDRPLIALLPGSRRHVIDAVLPLQLRTLRELRGRGREAAIAVSCVGESRRAQIETHLADFGVRGELVVGDNASLLSTADLTLVASGTAALEVAHYCKPLVVLYDAGPLLGTLYSAFGHWGFGIGTPHLSLVNILAGARVVPEFMPRVPDVAAVAAVVDRLLDDNPWRCLMIRQIGATLAPLVPSRASERVCEIMAEMLGGPAA